MRRDDHRKRRRLFSSRKKRRSQFASPTQSRSRRMTMEPLENRLLLSTSDLT